MFDSVPQPSEASLEERLIRVKSPNLDLIEMV